jgi:L-asparagine oxygenase
MKDMSTSVMAELRRNGYVFIPELDPLRSSLEVAECIGSVVDLHAAYPGKGLKKVHLLRAMKEDESRPNTYSAMLGLKEFPPHTDFANWASPPRYLMLRCIVGFDHVFTSIIPSHALLSCLGERISSRALFRPRRQVLGKPVTILPMCFSIMDTEAIRWDPRFLRPLNNEATEAFSKAPGSVDLQESIVRIQLSSPGDTLLIDNWRCLHGRSEIGVGALSRHLERVLLDEVRA